MELSGNLEEGVLMLKDTVDRKASFPVNIGLNSERVDSK